MANRLIHETSPYLLQHAENPVDWYPWQQEALDKALREDKPIFLSVGYSACHWCHVMAHESFEDEQVAAILNEHFVSVKVDREERPDLDRIYMSAVQAITGSGGWPMSVFLTPDGRPFYGGTYFPPTRRYGMPSFTEVLLKVTDAWQDRRHDLMEGGERLVRLLQRQVAVASVGEGETCQPETLRTAVANLQQGFDGANGGWGSAPKFPQSMVLELLLRRHHVTGDARALQMVTQTLDAMARGGMYDQIGGGFHRYSVDARWVTPHFEKMLYDNAQLARLYLHAWQVTGDWFYRSVTEEILDYVAREMTDSAGGFYGTQDADSEGEEGRFYVWTPGEIRDVLGNAAPRFLEAYDVTERGNFEGRNILTFSGTPEERKTLGGARRELLAARERRVPPGRDEKVLTSWNGLMLAAFAEAARALKREDYQTIAERNATFVLGELCTPDGRLWHTWKDGLAKENGFLDDYTHLVEGLIELYQTTFDPRWYTAARELADVMIKRFSAPVGFFDTSDDHEVLIVRPRELQDSAIPSGNGMAAFVLLRLAGLAVEPHYRDLATRSLCQVQDLLARHPLGFGQWLIALDYALSHPREIAIMGESTAADTQALLEVCRTGYAPHQVVVLGPPEPRGPTIPLLPDRGAIEGRATAYVCVDFVCRSPVTDAAGLQRLLSDSREG